MSQRMCVRKVEKILGRRLPKGVEVHHADGDLTNDSNNNLVVCQDKAYHKLLHIRREALLTCGNADWRKCSICKKYDDVVNMRFWGRGRLTAFYHRTCYNAYCVVRNRK